MPVCAPMWISAYWIAFQKTTNLLFYPWQWYYSGYFYFFLIWAKIIPLLSSAFPWYFLRLNICLLPTCISASVNLFLNFCIFVLFIHLINIFWTLTIFKPVCSGSATEAKTRQSLVMKSIKCQMISSAIMKVKYTEG